MAGDTAIREINTPEVRQAISAAIHEEVTSTAAAALATGRVFVVLDRASAGLPLTEGNH